MTAKKKKNVVGVNSRQQVEKATVNTHLAGFLSNEEKTFLGGKKNQKDTSRSANRWLHKRVTEECMHARSSDEAFRGDCTRARVALQPPKVRQVESYEYLIISRHVPRTAKRT